MLPVQYDVLIMHPRFECSSLHICSSADHHTHTHQYGKVQPAAVPAVTSTLPSASHIESHCSDTADSAPSHYPNRSNHNRKMYQVAANTWDFYNRGVCFYMKYSNLVHSPKFYFTCLFKDGKENLEFTFKYAAIFFSLTKKKNVYIFQNVYFGKPAAYKVQT